jgi:hypothetical protein
MAVHTMNRMLVIVLDTEAKAEAALRELRHLGGKGDITLHVAGMIAKAADGHVSAMKGADTSPVARQDFWVEGVGLHFVEEALIFLQPGKVMVVADVEEQSTLPLDVAMEALGGTVMRRARTDVVQGEFDQDIAAVKQEIIPLEAVYRHARAQAQKRLQARIDASASDTSEVPTRATLKLVKLGQETAIHVRSIEARAVKAQEKVRLRLATRLARVRKHYEKRAARLSRARAPIGEDGRRASSVEATSR